ncbi:hypothetical protein F4777DRAFT_574800 [Nemania sp. FL0916]|nr:hypothetical protein F4777DRAFT_574800 [Nemania sp. FL0916]
MCKIISNVTYACGHKEPWTQARSCQLDAHGTRKANMNPLCLIWGHCPNFGIVRQISLAEDKMLCSRCFVTKLQNLPNMAPEIKERRIQSAKNTAELHARNAESTIAASERRARLEDLPTGYIDKVTGVALKRLEMAFSDKEMEFRHFGELVQIIVALPLVDKAQLVKKFAGLVEERFGARDVRHFYKLSMQYRNFGNEFLAGLHNPDVITKRPRHPGFVRRRNN